MTVRVLVADDEFLVRAGLVALLRSEEDIEVVAEAVNGEEAIDLTCRHRPDVVLMDVRMPGTDGLTATARLHELAPGSRVVILTTFDLDEYVVEGLRAGASGFMLKSAPPNDLLAAVRTAAQGDSMIAPSATRRLIQRFVSAHDATTAATAPEALTRLTGRELEVLEVLSRGLSNQDLANELHISETTVKTHVSSILTKLGLRTRVQAVIAAYEAGLVHPVAGPPARAAEGRSLT